MFTLFLKKRLALSKDGIVGPFFFDDDGVNALTINKDRYLNVLKKKVIPTLERTCVNIEGTWFQQDGGDSTHSSCSNWLAKTFGWTFISFRTAQEWPPHSPDLNPLDFFLIWKIGCITLPLHILMNWNVQPGGRFV